VDRDEHRPRRAVRVIDGELVEHGLQPLHQRDPALVGEAGVPPDGVVEIVRVDAAHLVDGVVPEFLVAKVLDETRPPASTALDTTSSTDTGEEPVPQLVEQIRTCTPPPTSSRRRWPAPPTRRSTISPSRCDAAGSGPRRLV
jgi:hypothetical protein